MASTRSASPAARQAVEDVQAGAELQVTRQLGHEADVRQTGSDQLGAAGAPGAAGVELGDGRDLAAGEQRALRQAVVPEVKTTVSGSERSSLSTPAV